MVLFTQVCGNFCGGQALTLLVYVTSLRFKPTTFVLVARALTNRATKDHCNDYSMHNIVHIHDYHDYHS